MNPYDLNWERFLVAIEPETDAFLGCGQLVPLGNSGSLELRSLIVEPSHRHETTCREISPATLCSHDAGHVLQSTPPT